MAGHTGADDDGNTPLDSDQVRLQQLGYKQELKRDLSVVGNFVLSLSVISVMGGITTTYNTGLRYGRPVSATAGWVVVGAFNMCIALSMAEICSAYPTSGGLYYWSAKLAGDELPTPTFLQDQYAFLVSSRPCIPGHWLGLMQPLYPCGAMALPKTFRMMDQH